MGYRYLQGWAERRRRVREYARSNRRFLEQCVIRTNAAPITLMAETDRG